MTTMAPERRPAFADSYVRPSRGGGWEVTCRYCTWASPRAEESVPVALHRHWGPHERSEAHRAAKAAHRATRALVEAVAEAIERANP